MKSTNLSFEKILKKIKIFDTKTVCGYLIPAEILFLINKGWKLANSDSHKTNTSKSNIAQGHSNPVWVYFHKPSKIKIKDRHGAKNKQNPI